MHAHHYNWPRHGNMSTLVISILGNQQVCYIWMPKIFWRMFKTFGRSISSMDINAFQRIAGEQCSQTAHVQSPVLHIDLCYFKWAIQCQNDCRYKESYFLLHLNDVIHMWHALKQHQSYFYLWDSCLIPWETTQRRAPFDSSTNLFFALRYPQNEFRMLLKQLQAFGVKAYV